MTTSRIAAQALFIVALSAAGSSAGTAPVPGAADFDFLVGRWAIDNRRLQGLLRGSNDWQVFTSWAESRPLPGGIGNLEEWHTEFWETNWVMAFAPARPSIR